MKIYSFLQILRVVFLESSEVLFHIQDLYIRGKNNRFMINWNLLEMNNMKDAILSKLCDRLFHRPHHQVFHHLQCSFCKRSPDTLDAIVFTASGSEDKLCQYTFDNIEFIIITIGINNNKKSSRKVHKPICCKQYTITYFKYFTAHCYVIKEVFYPGSCQPDRGNSHI